jgi:small-conductance mechanosensitive channel
VPPSPADASQPSFFSALLADLRPRHIITALVLVALAIGFHRAVNLFFNRIVERHRSRGTLLPETATQLALVRRLLIAAVWLVTGGIALTQFSELRVLSTGLLASAGLSGLIVGFAARGTLGNAIAGLTISMAQPIRIGDDVEVRGNRGIVEDIHLIYTVLRLIDGKRLIIPNDTLASEVIKNLTMGGVTRIARVDMKVPLAGNPELVHDAVLAVARLFESLDRQADEPQVYYVKLDETGTLLTLVATCTDAASADRLAQKVLARAAQVVHRASP